MNGILLYLTIEISTIHLYSGECKNENTLGINP